MRRLHRTGWLLFLISAGLFVWSGLRSGDGIVVAASLVFGVACILFLIER